MNACEFAVGDGRSSSCFVLNPTCAFGQGLSVTARRNSRRMALPQARSDYLECFLNCVTLVRMVEFGIDTIPYRAYVCPTIRGFFLLIFSRKAWPCSGL